MDVYVECGLNVCVGTGGGVSNEAGAGVVNAIPCGSLLVTFTLVDAMVTLVVDGPAGRPASGVIPPTNGNGSVT
jgi:hypothetical protein